MENRNGATGIMARKPEDNSPAGNAARESIAKQQREHRRRSRGTDQTADWSDVEAEQLKRAICGVAGRGAAIQFGYTRDGGALVIRIVGDGEPFNEYVRPTEDVHSYFEALIADYAK